MKAELKPVRPFKKFSALTATTSDFCAWKKMWSKVHIEVGCGVGLHPILWAQENPKEGLVALERTRNKFQSFERRLKNHDLKNIFPLHQDALYWLPQSLSENSVDSYFFLFPNPYPKEAQANKRWHRNPLMEFILKSLKGGGLIHMATNEEWYMNEAEVYMRDYWNLSIETKTYKEAHSQKNPPQTHFEKKYLSRGETCFYSSFKKQDESRV